MKSNPNAPVQHPTRPATPQAFHSTRYKAIFPPCPVEHIDVAAYIACKREAAVRVPTPLPGKSERITERPKNG